MLITEAIKTLQSAVDVIGDDARLFVSVHGWTSDCLKFVGPCVLASDPSKEGISLAVYDRHEWRAPVGLGRVGPATQAAREVAK